MNSMDSEITMRDKEMASTRLKQLSFQRPKIWEKMEKMADAKGPNWIDIPTESKLLQQLTALTALRNLSDSGNLVRKKERALRMQENSVWVPQLA